jgi:Holliday junction resolvasome RuvABC ATP-dependent DNA helicase subunit
MRGVTLDTLAQALMSTAYDRDGQLPVVHPAISNRLSQSERSLLNSSEELLLSNNWIEKSSDGICMLTELGRAEVERRRQTV